MIDTKVYPEQGQTWRHFRGSDVLIHCLDFMPLSVRKGRTIYFGGSPKGQINPLEKAIAACDIPDESNIVIYKCSGKTWARSLDNFMEAVGDQPRFTLTLGSH